MLGLKFDGGKPSFYRAILLFNTAIAGACRAAEYGYQKYIVSNPDLPEDNWRTVPNGIERYSNAFDRHRIPLMVARSLLKEDRGRVLTDIESSVLGSLGYKDITPATSIGDALAMLQRDPESGLLHTDHLAWNGMAMSILFDDVLNNSTGST